MWDFSTEKPSAGRADRGFTLLEVLVALSIIAIVLVSVMRLQGQSITMNETARFYSVAPFLAQAKMAEIRLDPAQYLGGDSGAFDEFEEYSWQVVMEEIEIGIDDEAPVSMLSATVTVKLETNGQAYRLGQYIHETTEGLF